MTTLYRVLLALLLALAVSAPARAQEKLLPAVWLPLQAGAVQPCICLPSNPEGSLP